jgi:hypothetical protein
MKYFLCAYVEDCRMAEKYHVVEIKFDTLEEAESYYYQYEGKEIFNEEILMNDLAEIRYVVRIDKYVNGNLVELIKARYKVLDLEQFYPDFWKLFDLISSAKKSLTYPN